MKINLISLWWIGIFWIALSVVSVAQTTPEELVNAINYSVPASPAFELLPNKPSEVTNMVTPKDILATVPTFVNQGKVKTGVAADVRPFSYVVNTSLTDYQKNPFKQAIWRTVLAIGTAPDPSNNNDSFLSTGLRNSVIDKGDPRANSVYMDSLAKVYARALQRQGPPPFGMTTDQQKARHKIAVEAADSVRSQFDKDFWNKFRLDLGYAFMARAQNSSYRSDSLKSDRWGFWLAVSGGIGKKNTWFRKNVQLNAVGKATHIIRPQNDKSETGRYVAGARARFFVSKGFAFSIETSQMWSDYNKATDLSENWTHFAAIAEVNIPALGGWLTLGYGGDTAHRTASDSKFSFSYAIATNRIMKK